MRRRRCKTHELYAAAFGDGDALQVRLQDSFFVLSVSFIGLVSVLEYAIRRLLDDRV